MGPETNRASARQEQPKTGDFLGDFTVSVLARLREFSDLSPVLQLHVLQYGREMAHMRGIVTTRGNSDFNEVTRAVAQHLESMSSTEEFLMEKGVSERLLRQATMAAELENNRAVALSTRAIALSTRRSPLDVK